MEIRAGLAPDGRRWAWTEGLGEYDQQDFALPMTWHAGDWRDKHVHKVLDFIGNYVQTHPKRILAEQTMRYGWTTLTFRESAPDESPDGRLRLVIREIAEPLRDTLAEYVDGVERVLWLHMHQSYAAVRLGLNETDHPHRSMFATVCTRIDLQGGSPLFLWRRGYPKGQPHDPRDSRWLVGCTDREHPHNTPGDVDLAPLIHLVGGYVHIFPYLALPDDTSVVFEGGTATIFKPHDPHPVLDTESPFTGLDLDPLH